MPTETVVDPIETVNSASVSVPPIFITGVWRCGATLLYLLLNQHPDVALLYESDLPVLCPMFRTSSGRKGWVDKWEYWNASISRHDLDPARLSAPVQSLAEAFERGGREFALKHGKTRWGCKSPSYFDRIEHLAIEFPAAKFVVVWRDPEEICRSAMKAAASGPSGLWFARPGTNHKSILASDVLKKQVDKAMQRGASIHQIHYRDLVGDTANTMRGVCDFLQISFNPVVTVLDKSDRSAVFKGAHHAFARGSSIVSTEGRHQALPLKLSRKIDSYRTYWRNRDGDSWVLTRHFARAFAKAPGFLTRAKDRILYTTFRVQDQAPRIIFSILPLVVWQAYRRLKYKDALWIHRQITEKKTTLNLSNKTGRP